MLRAFCFLIGLLTVNSALAGVISFGSYQHDGRGLPGGDLGAALSNPTNFSALGYSGFSDAGDVSFGGLTSSYLNTVDIFFTDFRGIYNSPSASDISLLSSWVDDGGVLVINNDRSTSFTSMDPLLNAFGIDLVSAQTNVLEPLNLVDPSHPILNGPFGTVQNMTLRDASRYTALNSDVELISTWQNGDAAIAVLGPDAQRAGAVIALPDVERFLLDFDSTLGGGDTDIAALNAVAYAVEVVNGEPVPAPAPIALLGLGLAALGLSKRKKVE